MIKQVLFVLVLFVSLSEAAQLPEDLYDQDISYHGTKISVEDEVSPNTLVQVNPFDSLPDDFLEEELFQHLSLESYLNFRMVNKRMNPLTNSQKEARLASIKLEKCLNNRSLFASNLVKKLEQVNRLLDKGAEFEAKEMRHLLLRAHSYRFSPVFIFLGGPKHVEMLYDKSNIHSFIPNTWARTIKDISTSFKCDEAISGIYLTTLAVASLGSIWIAYQIYNIAHGKMDWRNPTHMAAYGTPLTISIYSATSCFQLILRYSDIYIAYFMHRLIDRFSRP